MAALASFLQGESVSIGFVLPVDYDLTNIDEIKVYLGAKSFANTITDNVVKCEIKSDETKNLLGNQNLVFWLDDKIFGVKKKLVGVIEFNVTNAISTNESVNTEYDIIVTLEITETAIEVGDVLYDYLKGADGNGIESITLISTVGLVKTYRITYTDGTTFDYDVKDGEQGDKGDDGLQGLKGDKGDKGDAFTYEDFTPEQILELQSPALQAQEIVLQTNDEITQAEAERVAVGLSLQIKIQSDITILTTGDGKYIYTIPAKLNGYDIESIHASLTTASSSGLPQFKVYNLRSAAEILSTNVTIDSTEFSSYTALTQPVVNPSNKGVLTGDRLRIDCVGAGTGAKGFGLIIKFVKP